MGHGGPRGVAAEFSDGLEHAVPASDFATDVRRRVKQLTGGTQNPQVPFLQDFDTDAAIALRP